MSSGAWRHGVVMDAVALQVWVDPVGVSQGVAQGVALGPRRNGSCQ